MSVALAFVKRKASSDLRGFTSPSFVTQCSDIFITIAMAVQSEGSKEWEMEHDPFSDPEERRVLFAALDSFR